MIIKGTYLDTDNQEQSFSIEEIHSSENKAFIIEEKNNLISGYMTPIIYTEDYIPKSYFFDRNNKEYIFEDVIKTSLTEANILLVIEDITYIYINKLIYSKMIIKGQSTVVVNNLINCSVSQSDEAQFIYNRAYGNCRFKKEALN